MKIVRQIALLTALGMSAVASWADIFHNEDGAIIGRLCVGMDCTGNDSQNNFGLEIKNTAPAFRLNDTSGGTSELDWAIYANRFGIGGLSLEDLTGNSLPFLVMGGSPSFALTIDPAGIGLNKQFPEADLHIAAGNTATLRLEKTGFLARSWDILGGSLSFEVKDVATQNRPFRINGSAPSNRIVLSGSGNVGVGEGFPERALHVTSSDTPTLRLDQDGAGGPPEQVWDIGGNEANFFVRDAGTDRLPFRIRPGAPDNALYVAANGEIGIGIPDPNAALHIRRNQPDNVAHLILQNRRANGRAEIWFEDDKTPTDNDALRMQLNGDVFNISFNGTGGAELAVTKVGDVRIQRGNLIVPNGGVIVGGQSLDVPDYVFASDYDVMPLSAVQAFIDQHSHLPYVPSANDIQTGGLNMAEMQMGLLRTVEELTLHTLEQGALINTLLARSVDQENTIASLKARLESMEDR